MFQGCFGYENKEGWLAQDIFPLLPKDVSISGSRRRVEDCPLQSKKLKDSAK
jgi:hypothetical protein